MRCRDLSDYSGSPSPYDAGHVMAEEPTFTVTVARLHDYEFNVRFDWEQVPSLHLDEPEPLGHAAGPNASRILAAAVGNCLSASLLLCLTKAKIEPQTLTATVTGRMVRNPAGRLRIGALSVSLELEGGLEPAARLSRCAELFEEFCVVTESVRQGIPVQVAVSHQGQPVYSSV